MKCYNVVANNPTIGTSVWYQSTYSFIYPNATTSPLRVTRMQWDQRNIEARHYAMCHLKKVITLFNIEALCAICKSTYFVCKKNIKDVINFWKSTHYLLTYFVQYPSCVRLNCEGFIKCTPVQYCCYAKKKHYSCYEDSYDTAVLLNIFAQL